MIECNDVGTVIKADTMLKEILSKDNSSVQFAEVDLIKDLEVAKFIIKRLLNKIN